VPSSSTIGSRINKARKQLGLSHNELAHRGGVKAKTLDNWLEDRSAPRADKLMRLSGVLQVPLVWLLSGKMPDGADLDPVAPATTTLARRVERATAMQQELADLLAEISADIARLQRDLKSDTPLVA